MDVYLKICITLEITLDKKTKKYIIGLESTIINKLIAWIEDA